MIYDDSMADINIWEDEYKVYLEGEDISAISVLNKDSELMGVKNSLNSVGDKKYEIKLSINCIEDKFGLGWVAIGVCGDQHWFEFSKYCGTGAVFAEGIKFSELGNWGKEKTIFAEGGMEANLEALYDKDYDKVIISEKTDQLRFWVTNTNKKGDSMTLKPPIVKILNEAE